jgi:hypothetical protein
MPIQYIIGHVTECYDHDDSHRIVEVIANDCPKDYRFFYVPKTPDICFGDIVQMNFEAGEFFLFRGNSRFRYRINPEQFPGTLLLELIQQRINQDNP